MAAVVELNGVDFSYGSRLVLGNIELAVFENDFLAVVGPNGSGKTTLLRLILGFLIPDQGRVSVFGLPADKAGTHIGYVPQHGNFDAGFPISALEVVLMGRLHGRAFLPRYSEGDYRSAESAMHALRVYDLAHRPFGALSGGQKQRILIARALAAAPKLLVLDEPTAGVDEATEKDIWELLARLNEEVTIIVVSHNAALIAQYAKEVLYLDGSLKQQPGYSLV
ncbi:MAG: ABC transporter ATP-binding protein [Firmicutes bacterium]|nr:ABC transporter ATP-binding protein [Bacillota bacterium]